MVRAARICMESEGSVSELDRWSRYGRWRIRRRGRELTKKIGHSQCFWSRCGNWLGWVFLSGGALSGDVGKVAMAVSSMMEERRAVMVAVAMASGIVRFFDLRVFRGCCYRRRWSDWR